MPRKKPVGKDAIAFVRQMLHGYKTSAHKDDVRLAKIITNLIGEVRRSKTRLYHAKKCLAILEETSDDPDVCKLIENTKHQMQVPR